MCAGWEADPETRLADSSICMKWVISHNANKYTGVQIHTDFTKTDNTKTFLLSVTSKAFV